MFVWQKGVHHVRETSSPYPPEVRVEAVRLVREGGVSLKEAADTVGCSLQTMRNWVLQ